MKQDIRTYEIFTEKFSVMVKTRTIMGAIKEFGKKGYSDRIIKIDDRTYIENI
jgi:hypothetical protein